ncbi:hypothetical protein G5V59_27385 [Nocardioides sp. W3-2-3]|uniref:hypothetical protein n=1 Tax=Nocardioides convexus TaxID=2712224 RepID=UPI00241892AC|nr:hypothetical protein [Nocardioides convexus]NHA02106.1 hypothetical protein [Nocardioides convexus]
MVEILECRHGSAHVGAEVLERSRGSDDECGHRPAPGQGAVRGAFGDDLFARPATLLGHDGVLLQVGCFVLGGR